NPPLPQCLQQMLQYPLHLFQHLIISNMIRKFMFLLIISKYQIIYYIFIYNAPTTDKSAAPELTPDINTEGQKSVTHDTPVSGAPQFDKTPLTDATTDLVARDSSSKSAVAEPPHGFIDCIREDDVLYNPDSVINTLILNVNVGTVLNIEEFEQHSSNPQPFSTSLLKEQLEPTLPRDEVLNQIKL
ncbi:hypothetical protein ACJX0J_042098, partial [Zea mays]